jgi:dolichol kinase
MYSIANEHKSLSGSISFFAAALILGFVLLSAMDFTLVLPAFITVCLVAAISAITEGISPKGLDNITIPAVVILVLFFTGYS